MLEAEVGEYLYWYKWGVLIDRILIDRETPKFFISGSYRIRKSDGQLQHKTEYGKCVAGTDAVVAEYQAILDRRNNNRLLSRLRNSADDAIDYLDRRNLKKELTMDEQRAIIELQNRIKQRIQNEQQQ